MNIPLIKKANLALWDLAIQLLSENKLIRKMVPQVYAIIHQPDLLYFIAVAALIGFSGLFSGFLLDRLLKLQ
jgi:hypothetical protein